MNFILFILGALIFGTYFYPYLFFANVIVNFLVIGHGITSKTFKACVFGGIFMTASFVPSLNFLHLILGVILMGGSIVETFFEIPKSLKEEPAKEESNKRCLERQVFGDVIILEIFELDNMKYCELKTIDNNFKTVQEIEHYKNCLSRALERVRDLIQEDPNMYCIWH